MGWDGIYSECGVAFGELDLGSGQDWRTSSDLWGLGGTKDWPWLGSENL